MKRKQTIAKLQKREKDFREREREYTQFELNGERAPLFDKSRRVASGRFSQCVSLNLLAAGDHATFLSLIHS